MFVLLLAPHPRLIGILETPYMDGSTTRLSGAFVPLVKTVAQLLALSLAPPAMLLSSSKITFLTEKASRSCTNKFVLQRLAYQLLHVTD